MKISIGFAKPASGRVFGLFYLINEREKRVFQCGGRVFSCCFLRYFIGRFCRGSGNWFGFEGNLIILYRKVTAKTGSPI